MEKYKSWGFFGMMFFACLVFGFVIFRGIWAEPATAVRALETQGYSEIHIIDHSWFMIGVQGCSGNDAAKFTAIAKNPAGKEVECFVCVGWPFKGATVRTD